MPSQSSSLPSDLQAFIQAEMARRCLSSEEECLHALAREIMQEQGADKAVDLIELPPGPKSAAALESLLEARLNTIDQARPMQQSDWQQLKDRALMRAEDDRRLQ